MKRVRVFLVDGFFTLLEREVGTIVRDAFPFLLFTTGLCVSLDIQAKEIIKKQHHTVVEPYSRHAISIDQEVE